MIAQAILSQQSQTLTVLAAMTLPLAWWLGRKPERALALVMTAMITLDLLRLQLMPGWVGTAGFRPDYAVLHLLALICVGVIALNANRLYPLVMAGAALVAVLAHGLRWLNLFDGQLSYLMLITAPSFVMYAALWTGLGLHVWRERRVGNYPDWRSSPHPASDCRSTKFEVL